VSEAEKQPKCRYCGKLLPNKDAIKKHLAQDSTDCGARLIVDMMFSAIAGHDISQDIDKEPDGEQP